MNDTPTYSRPLHPAPDLSPEQRTPMFEQYLAIKKNHEDALLFFRMGDFYELFFDDAVVAAKALQITLTSRNPQAEKPIPMCGVPHHSHQSYVQQLLDKGFKVAICDQLEDPKSVKGLVKRGVKEVRTQGTTVEDAGLDPKGHNYLGAVYWDAKKERGGFSWMEFSTGEWTGLFSKNEADIWQWVRKIQPRELLVPDLSEKDLGFPKDMALYDITPVRLPMRSYFDRNSAEKRILEALRIGELGAVGLNGKDALTQACGAIIAYLLQTQKQELTHLKQFVPLDPGQHLIVDEITERNLELFRRLDGKKGLGTLLHILDETLTPMGGRLLEERLRHPWRSLGTIQSSADAVSFFFEHGHNRVTLRQALEAVYDLERLSTRISLGRTTPKDLVALGQSLAALPGVREALEAPPPGQYPSPGDLERLPRAVRAVHASWDSLEDVAQLLGTALLDSPPPVITEGGLFKAGYHPELDELLDLVEHGEQRLQDLLAQEQREHGLGKLKLGYNRVFGYYFELPKSMSDAAPAHFTRRQTVANAERYISPALKDLEDKILAAGDSRKQLEYKLFQELRDRIKKEHPRIIFMAESLAGLDYWQSLAEVAHRRGWVRPEPHEGTDLSIRQGRHPVVEAMAGPAGFVPNDLYMDAERRLLLITGPNMAGKSTVLRQTALIVILAHMGSFVPASSARVGLADRIFSRVGASDNLAQGQSTFMVEMMETARILRQATRKSVVILDEIGRGTSTFDGLSLAWAVVEDLVRRADSSIRTLFATHYHELTALQGRLPGVHTMNIAITEHGGEMVFLRRLVPGPSDRSYGIEVAKLAGVPAPVVQRAKRILELLESSRDAVKEQSNQVMRQLLPGLSAPETAETPKHTLFPADSGEAVEVEHPLFTILRDLDTDNLTPMQAFTLVSDWKALWGGEKQ